MSFSRAPILRFNDTKPSGNNVPTVKSQHTPRNEKKTTTTRTRPVVTTKKTSSYESGSTRSPSARSPWGLCAAGAQPTSLSLPTTPISQTSCSPAAVGVAVDSATVFAHSAMSPPAPAPAPGPAPAPARSARAASTGRSSAAPTLPRQPAPRAPGPAHAAPAPPAPASPRGRSAPPHPPPVAPIANADSADDAIDDIDDASVTSKEEKKTHSNASSETKSVKEDDGDNTVNTRIRSRSPSSRRSVDKRKTLLDQQYQDKRRKFVAARKELADKQKVVSSETVSTHQEGRHRHPDVTSRDPSSERDRSERDRSEGDNLDTDKEVHSSGKSTTDSEVWDKKCDEEEIDTVHWPDPEKTDVPTDAGSCMLKQLRDISNSYSGQVKELVRKRNHLLALVGGLIAMKRPVVCEELRKQFQECQKEADQLDLRMDDMRRIQTDSISSFGEAINSLAAEHERVKAELATALKVKSELESRGGSARLIARATAEEKRLRAQAEKATAQLGALSAELQQERARGERVDAHAQLLAQELQQANVRLQELEGKLKEQTAIAHQMKEAVRLNQTQIHNMIIERCSMLREYTEVKNKADTEVNIIVREMETRLDLVNRRLQEEIEMSERLREQNWTFRNLLEESEARKRAVELFDRGVQTTGGGGGGGGGAKGAGHHDGTATRPGPGMGSASDSLVSDSEAVRSDGGDGPEDTPPSDEDDDDEEEDDNEDDDVTYENDGDCGGGEDDETPPGGPRGGAGGGARDGPDQRKAGEAEAAVPGGWPASAGASRSAPGSREERERGRRRRSGSASDPSVKRGPRHTTAESSSDTEADSATLRAPEAETVAEAGAGPEEAVTVWERVPRPVPSGDTEVSFDLDDSGGGGGGGGGAPSDSSSDCEHKRRERELKTEMESAHIALQMEKEFARALEEEMMKIQLQKATLEVESIKIADEKAILQHNMHKASVRERELREHFEKEFVRKLVRELIPKEQEIERLQVQVQELTKLADFNKQQFAEYERRMQELASGFEAPNAQGGVTSLREVVSDLHSHVESMRQSLQEVRGRNERLERALEAKGAEAAAQAQLALRRSRALQARDAQLQSLSAAMRQRDRHSSKIEKEVRRQTEQMSQLQALLQTRDSQLSRLTDMVEQMAIAPRPLALRTPPSTSSASATAPATPSQTPPAPASLGRSRASTPTQPPATPSASGGGGDVEMSCSKPELSWEPSTDLWTSSVDDTRASSIQPGSAGSGASGEEVSVHGTPTSGGGGRSPETCTPVREQPTAVAHWPNAIAQAFSEAAALAAAQQRRSPTPTPAPTQLLSRESSPAAPERVTSPSTPPPSATRMSTPVSTPRPQLLPAVPPRSAPSAPAAASASVRARRSRPATLAPPPLPPPPSSPTPSPREFPLSAPVGPRGSRAAAIGSSAAARGEWWAAPAGLGARRRSATAVAYLASQRSAFEPGASDDEAEREGAAKAEAALPSQLAHVAGRARGRGRGRSRARSHAPDADCALAAEPDHCPKPQAPRGAALGEGDRAGPGAGMGSPVGSRPAPPPTAPRGFSPRCRRPQSALLFLESAPKEPAEERRAASVPDYAPPQPPNPAALWRQSGRAAARHARSSTPSRPPPPPGPDDAAWKARKKVDAPREGKAATDDLERRVLGVRSPPALPPPPLLFPLQAPPPTRRLPLLPSLDGPTGSTRRCRSLDSRERLLAPHGPAAAELSLAARPCTAPGRGTGPRTDAASAPARPRFPWRGALAPRHDDAPNAHPAPRTPPRAPRACPCPVLASAPLSSYDAFIREHLIAPPTPPARATGSHVCGGKAARGDGAKWVCHCSASFDRRSPIPFALGAAAWDEGEKSGTASFGAGPLRKEQRSQEAEVSPCRDSDLQACAPPTRPGSGDGSGAGRGSSPDPGQRLRLSPFRQIAELPKIVEFAEDSSLESTSVDSGHTHSQDASDQGKPLIIRYRKIESSTKSSPPHSSVVFHFNGSPLEAEDRNLTPGTLSIISSDSKTGDGNDSRGTQPQKYVVPYIQEVKMIMENLESMLESRVRNDVALITSKSTSSQTGPEMLVECRSRLESSARRQERRPESPEYEAEETGETRRDASDTSLDNTMGTSEYGSLSSQSKRGVSVKHSLSSLTGKARTAKRCGPPRCPIGEKVIVPCLAHNRIKRSRSGSYIHDDHFALKLLVPEFHVVHTNCSCQKNRDKLS